MPVLHWGRGEDLLPLYAPLMHSILSPHFPLPDMEGGGQHQASTSLEVTQILYAGLGWSMKAEIINRIGTKFCFIES